MARKRFTNTNYKTVNNNAYRADQARFEEEERLKENRRQQALIDAQYQQNIADQEKRGGLDRVFDVMSTGGYMVNGLVQDGLEGAWKGLQAGMDGFAIGNKEYGTEYSAKGTLNKVTGGKWDEMNGDIDSAGKAIDALKQGEFGKFAVAFGKGLTEFAGEVATDPTTYLGGAGIAKSLAKGTGKRVGGEAVEKVTTQAIKKAGAEKSLDVTSKEALRYANKANKILGNATTVGDVTFAGKKLIDGDAIRAVGDKTIAPLFNSFGDAVKQSGVTRPFSNQKKLYDALQTDMTEFVGAMKLKDMNVKQKLARNSYIGKMSATANNILKNEKVSDSSTQRFIMDYLENPNNYHGSTTFKETGEFGKATIKEYIELATNKSYDEMSDRSAKRVWDNILTSDTPYERMAQPKDRFEEFVVKKMIDPDNKYLTYREAYDNFVQEQHLRIKSTPQAKPEVASTIDGMARKMMDKPLSDMDISTGVFVNTHNQQLYSELLKNNKAMTRIVNLNNNRKAEWLNRVLFDGKPVIDLNNALFGKKGKLISDAKIEGKLNGVVNLIKQGADEDEIFRALEGFVNGGANKNYIDIALNEEQIERFLATGDLDELYDFSVVQKNIEVDKKIYKDVVTQKDIEEIYYEKKSNKFSDILDNDVFAPQELSYGKIKAVVQGKSSIDNFIKFNVIGATNKNYMVVNEIVNSLTPRHKKAILNMFDHNFDGHRDVYQDALDYIKSVLSETSETIEKKRIVKKDFTDTIEEIVKENKTIDELVKTPKYDNKNIRLYNANTRELIGDNLSGAMRNRTSPMAEEMRLAKQAKLSAIEDITAGVKEASATDLTPQMHMSKQEVLTRLGHNFEVEPTSGMIRDNTDGVLYSFEEMRGKFMEEDMRKAYVENMPDTSYDPFTRQTLEELGDVTYDMTELDHYLNVSMKEKTLNESINDFLRNKYDDAINTDYVVKNGELFIEKVDYGIKLDDPTLSREVKEAISFVFDEFKRMGMNERSNNKLRTMINNYVPHVLNRDLLSNPQIMNKIKKDNPELYRQIFASSGDKWNRFGSQRSASLEANVKEILVGKYERAGMYEEAKQVTGKTIAEVNEALKPMLKEYGFSGDFFVNEIYDAYIQRMVTHGEVIYSDKIIDDTLENFGKYVQPREVKPNKTYYLNQRTMKEVFSGLDETQQFELIHSMGIDFDKVYNKMMVEVNGKQLDKLYNAVEKYGNAPLTAYELPPSIAQYAQTKGYTQQLEDSNAFLKVYDKFTNIWKQSATVINPGFHIRNGFSNTFQNFLAVGSDTFNPKVRNDVKGVLTGADGVLKTPTGTVTFQEIRDQLVARDIVNFQNFSVEGQQVKTKTLFGEELKGNGGIFEAIGRKLNAENPTAFNKIDPTDTANFLPYHVGRTFGGKIEDFDRTLNFISNIKNGMDFADAEEMVNKFLFDYSDLTSFESNVMKRVIPFYTWLRKNAPLQMEMLLEKPWLYAGIADVHRMSTENADTTNLPEYMSDWVKLPINLFGKDTYLNPNMPYQDLDKVTMGVKDVVGMLNPAIKVPLELGMNYNTFFGSPIYNEDDSMSEARDKQAQYVMNSLGGAWNTIGKGISALGSGDAEKILTSTGSLATGVKIGLHDTEKAKEDAIYRAIRELEQQWNDKKIQGKFNQPFEEYKKTKLKKYGYTE